MNQTPDLSSFKGSFPKPNVKGRKHSKSLSVGRKVTEWNAGRQDLKAIFKDQGITSCELMLEKCKPKFSLGFAHITRRKNLTDEEIIDPHYVVLACQICHETVDFKMPKEESEKLLENIVKARGW